MMSSHPWFIWGIVALVTIGAIAFGAISLTTNLFTAVGIGLIVVGAALLFQRTSNQAIGLAFVIGGALLWMGHDLLPQLTIGGALTFTGVSY